MSKYIELDALVAEIERLKDDAHKGVSYHQSRQNVGLNNELSTWEHLESAFATILKIIDTLEVKEVNLELITGWFDHIAQIADDRMTLTNQRMTDAHAIDEIKCLAKNSSEFITKHYKAQKGE